MKERPPPTPEQAMFLAQLVRETRERPERFARGASFLETRFNFEAIVARRESKRRADLEEGRQANQESVRRTRAHIIRSKRRELRSKKLGRAKINAAAREASEAVRHDKIPILRVLEDEASRGVTEHERKYGPRTMPRDEAREWAVEQTWLMSREEAEAVCLVATLFYDDNPAPNPALPSSFQAMPWAHPSTVQSDEDVIGGRWLHVFFHGLDLRLIETARYAQARLSSYPPDQVLAAVTTELRAQVPDPIVIRDTPPAEMGETLTEQDLVFMKILLESPPHLWLKSQRLCDLFAQREKRLSTPSDSVFRSRTVPKLKTWGLAPGGKLGYRLPDDALARKVFKVGG
jgi:hypothetical protein